MKRSLTALRKAAAGCRRCDLWKRGTQTVFGEGSSCARLMLVGEQPGDQEDPAGGKFFDSTLAPFITLTVLPSSILRAPDAAARQLARQQFVNDLKRIARKLGRI